MASLLDRLIGRPDPPAFKGLVLNPAPLEVKAVTSGVAWSTAVGSVSSWSNDPVDRAAAYLRAYKVGWFYKAESKISLDIAILKRSLAPEDAVGDNETDILEADLTTPWERLDPPHQFLRLMERPNPNQTGRQLFQKTQIRVDMAGWTFWYMENAGPVGSGVLPTAIYGISPTRLTPSFDNKGNLIGWVLDKNSPSGGVPFQTYEIVMFSHEMAEDGTYGQGVVEAVMSELPIGNQLSGHQSDLLATGGRLAGMLWPKNRTLLEGEFQDAQRAWRNVSSDPNAARRLLLFPEPMEWSSGAATPDAIGIPELATLNRDNILTAFPISPYQLGVPTPGGLNSGETRREDRKDYWEGTIHPRVELLEEVIQTRIVSLYEAVTGQTYDFDITEPNLDDAASLLAKVTAFDKLVEAGFKAEDAIAALGLDDMEWTKPAPVVIPPSPPPPPLQPGDQPASPPAAAELPTKSVETERDAAVALDITRARGRLERFFTEQKQRVTANMRTQLPASKAARMKAQPTWWDPEEEDRELTAAMREIYTDVGRAGLQAVATTLDRFIFKGATQSVIADLLTVGGERIKDINARTLQALTIELAEGTRRGYSIPQLIEGVPDEGYKGVLNAGLDNGTGAWSELRAETIARTETMLSYNRATVTGYGEFGVTSLLAYDGDGDEECAARNGQEFTIAEAEAIEDHPNGTLVWSPVVDKAVHEPLVQNFLIKAADAQPPADLGPVVAAIEVLHSDMAHVFEAEFETMRAIKAIAPPQVTVESPNITVEAPIVNVAAPPPSDVHISLPPDIRIEPPDMTAYATALADLTETLRKPRKVLRDKSGRIIGLEER